MPFSLTAAKRQVSSRKIKMAGKKKDKRVVHAMVGKTQEGRKDNMEARRPQSALPSRKRDWTLGDEPQQDSHDAKLFSPIRDISQDFTDLERFSKFARNPQRPSSAPPRQHDSSMPGASSAGLVGRRLFSQTGADSGNAFLPSVHFAPFHRL